MSHGIKDHDLRNGWDRILGYLPTLSSPFTANLRTQLATNLPAAPTADAPALGFEVHKVILQPLRSPVIQLIV